MRQNIVSISKQVGAILIVVLGVSSCATSSKAGDNYNYSPAVVQQSNTSAGAVKRVPMQVSSGQTTMVAPKINYSDNRRLVGTAAVDVANSKALRKPKSSGYINSIMTFDYMPGALYQVYCAPLRVTDIQLQNNEHIISVGAGDTLRWQVSKTYSGAGANRQEHLLIKPTDEGLVNTLVITTDQRTYHIMLYSTARTYMASVAWRYADSDGLLENLGDMPQSAGASDNTGFGQNLDMNRLNFGYNVVLKQGKRPDWYPSMVFNDGSKTYIKFPTNMQEAPTLFVGSSTKISQIVNYRVVGNYYVVDGIYDQTQLRSGQNNPIIVQIAYKGY